MSSIHKWKLDSHQNVGTLTENGEFHDNRGSINIEKTDIPVWKRNLLRRSSVDDSKINSGFDNNNTNKNENTKDGYSSVRPSKFLSRESDTCLNSTQDTVKMGKDNLLRPSPDETLNNVDSSGNVVSAHLKHVHSNPFFQEYGGIIHPHGHIYDDSSIKGQSVASHKSVDDHVNNEDEYGPVSGFVSKLRKKFSVLSVQQDEDGLRQFPTRKYASVENLCDTTHKQKSSIDKSPAFNCPIVSFDKVNLSKNKPKIVPKPSAVKSSRKYSEGDTFKSQHRTNRQEQNEHADLDIGRDDIIIIEHSKPSTSPRSKKDPIVNDMEVTKVRTLKEDKGKDELPKPNTVSSFRSMFEKNVSKQNILPDTPKLKTTTTGKNAKQLTVKATAGNESPLSSPVNKSPVGSLANTEISKTVSTTVEKSSSESNIKPSTMKERAQENPRVLDSPVTRKKLQAQSKSIFDSESIKSKKKEPALKQILLTDTNTSKTAEMPASRINKTKIQVKVKEPKSELKSKDNTFVIKTKNSDSKVFESKENISKPIVEENKKTQEYFPNKREIFDSSLIEASPKKEVRKSGNTPRVESESNVSEKISLEKKEISQSVSSSIVSSHGKRKKAPPKPPSPVQKAEDKIIKDNASISSNDIKVEKSVKQNESVNWRDNSVTVSESNTISESAVNTKPRNTGLTDVSDIKTRVNNSDSNIPSFVPLPSETKNKTPLPPRPEQKPLPPLNLSQNDNRTETTTNNFSPINTTDSSPTRGLPSVIRNRLKKKTNDIEKESVKAETQEESDDDDSQHSLIKPSQLLNSPFVNGSTDSPVPSKRNKKNDQLTKDNSKEISKSDSSESKSSPMKSKTPSSNIEDLIRKKRSSPAAVFDSSNIVPVAKPKVNGVPPLDLTDLISEKKNHRYQEGYIDTKIEPCKIVFHGAGVKFQSNPLKKTRSGAKLKIQFDEKNSTTHEYPNEDWALEEYLRDHPHETEEAEKQQEEGAKQQEATLNLLNFDGDESTDDPTPSTPREKESPIKSNTPIGIGSGELSSYKSKIQVGEYQFGMVLQEPEPVSSEPVVSEPDPEDMHLLPADEEDLHNFTDVGSSDMLF